MRSNQKRVQLAGQKRVVGCQAETKCGCKCRPCAKGTIVLVTCNVPLDVTLADLAGDPIPNGRIVRILPEHQLRFVAPKVADELKRILEEALE